MSIGSGVCGDETEDRSSFAKVVEGTHGSLVGAGPAAFVSVSGQSLDAHEWNDVSVQGSATGNVRRDQRAVSDKEEEEPTMLSYQVEHVVSQQGFSTG
jgi:hypothetical protein